MKKILILDDRIKRQESFLNDSNLAKDFFVKYSDLVDNLQDSTFEKFKQKLAVEDQYGFLKDYACVIVHRSAFSKEIVNKIFAFCSKNNINLVYFSGGISSTNLQGNDKFSFLTINSKQFYSSNLTMFLEEFKQNGKDNLGLLAFGEQYELNILLTFSYKLSFFNALQLLKEDCVIDEFVQAYDIDNELIMNILKNKFDWFDDDNADNPLKTLTVVKDAKELIEKIVTEKVRFND
ncbi:hypothetical protein [Flavobacterium granuli]|uniref:Uncharacterized protein n=1 Tax=Flavobacterium granuli TaxID=280093 RepID=A0ABU1S3T9_9FLAO|nr:hypothetical protein [Flavobacterium granuli]MDR6845668.1 hypothetical protein [Flavobacterium granuli]